MLLLCLLIAVDPRNEGLEDEDDALETERFHGEFLSRRHGRGGRRGGRQRGRGGGGRGGTGNGSALGDLREVVDDADEDVAAVEVAVVVDVEVGEGARVAADVGEELEDHPLVVDGAVGALEDAEEDVREEDADLGLERGAVVAREAVEDREAVAEDARVRAHAVAHERAAQLPAHGGLREAPVCAQHRPPALDDRVQQLERERAAPRRLRLLARARARVRLVRRQPAQRPEQHHTVLVRYCCHRVFMNSM